MSFNEAVSKWETEKLSQLTDYISRGITPKYTEDKNRSILVVNQRCIREGKVLFEDARRHDIEKKKISEEKFLRDFDVLVNSTGVGTLGRVSQIKKVHEPTTVDSHVTIVRGNADYIDKKYLGYAIKAQQSIIENMAEGSTGQTELSRKRLGDEIVIGFPKNKQEQKAIAHILSILDDKIEVNNEINKTLENMAQVIFKQWFVDFEFPNEDGEPYKSSGGEMVESELGMIPKGWEVKKVEQVTKIIRGASPRPIQDFIRDEGIPWVKISDASSSNTRFISSTKEFIKEEGRKKSREVKVGTLILSNSATPGIPMIMKIDACVHDGWLIFDEFREVTKEYMFHFLTENRIGILSLSNGSVFRNLKTDILKNYKIIIPSRDVVARVDNIFKSINNSIDNIENQITTLTKIRDGLLTKLMSGEIRVPLDEEGDVS
ncbi:restriction endonuclease subunit S [Anaerotalea alkaliphila]|uniref:Restriction endonuclease subunit S n=1 Tax=Anaerotalea alkaliphila TaxID=2662126 RepID=A0A7X5KMI8_9FIRM|nr:restriction endonuclease subunit S [Anaerotalea alkaliphila]NDL66768.1 restriction endonuclease subunit S [Anaerotalea alkaliphila]